MKLDTYMMLFLNILAKVIQIQMAPCTLPDKVMFYRNTQNAIKSKGEILESFLDSKDDLAKYDAHVIHGHKSKEEKAAFLKHFSNCNEEKMNIKKHV